MSTTIANFNTQAVTAERSNPAYQAYQILHLGFTAAPILAGIDKFFHLLCNWDQYLAPWVSRLSPVSGHTLMLAVGVVEAAAGILVAVKPRIGAPVVGVWLWLIILNLLTMGAFYDVALRDLGLALGAFALWRLAEHFAR
ncbi:MAG: hypothetical protein EPN40_06575 [Rhodanobacteraceae bacterium]|nr:MAG: hypothetical protein EPN40_06575 [Rhodanobacteraceae bacterium]